MQGNVNVTLCEKTLTFDELQKSIQEIIAKN